MTTKTINGSVYASSGYVLSGAYGTISVGALGHIGGVPGAGSADTGGIGLARPSSLAGSFTLTNAGAVTGGSGGAADSGDGGAGGTGVSWAGAGAITNSGSIGGGAGGAGNYFAFGGLGGDGVDLLASARLTNSGTITGGAGGSRSSYFAKGGVGGAGVVLNAGGTVTNNAGLIAGGAGGGGAPGANGNVGGVGVALHAGGTIRNNGGTITGGAGGKSGYSGGVAGQGGAGVYLAGGALLVNTGAVSGGLGGAGSPVGGAGVGVALLGGSVRNGSASGHTALISGVVGVYAVPSGPGTVTNFGTIAGSSGTSVKFASASDRLIAEAGSAFIGKVLGGGGTLELANGSGTINGLGGVAHLAGTEAMTFSGFSRVAIDAAASWTLAGSNTRAAGQSLSSAGAMAITGSLAGAGTLAFTGGAASFASGAALTIAKVAQSGSSTVAVDASLAYAGVWTQTAGTVSVVSGQTLSLSGTGDVFKGALDGAGTVALTGGTDRLAGTTISVAHLTIAGPASVTLAGAIANSGAITASTSHLLVDVAGAILAGGGSLTLTSAAANKISAAAPGAVLTNADNLIQGGGQLGGGSLGVVNQAAGRITGNAAVALVINTGASTIHNAGTITAAAGGGVKVQSAIDNTGVLAAVGGVMTLGKDVTGTGQAHINTGGTIVAAGAFSENVQFTGASGTLELAHAQAYAGKVSGFSHAGTTSLDLDDIAFVSSSEATFSGTASGGTLTVVDGTHTAMITLVGNYTGVDFVASSDGHGGTTVIDQAKAAAVHSFVAAGAAMTVRGGSSSPATHWTPPAATAPLAHPRS